MSQSAAENKKPSYKKTLNLPKTSFPMKANLVQNEPASLKRWSKGKLYDALKEERAGTDFAGGRFVFHDGPPYANGSIHLGHMLNKCLKDFVVRSKVMEGMSCEYVPGWDCHGLPIEHKVMQELSESGKLAKLQGLEEGARRMAVRRECKKYAEKFIKVQRVQMERLMTLADYDNPYLTMVPSYEGAVVEVFAELVERGVVYRQLKSVHWSIANETALADAELEYYDREDISVYVDFEAADAGAVYDAFGLTGEARPDQTPCFMIWTTTPWTLAANLGIAVHPRFEYVLARVDGNYTVLAEGLLEKVTKQAGAEEVEIIAKAKGEALLELRYKHPMRDAAPALAELPKVAVRHAEEGRCYRVIAAEYVTLEDGTGLVHTAPGHGSDDYITGVREKLPIYCPVNGDGTYDGTVPEKYTGMSVWDANEKVTEDLRTSGHLFYSHKFMHSYPHDWRGKTPVIFRATEQWFITVDDKAVGRSDSLREMALSATAEGVRFVPDWGRNRMRGMLESRPDWCISRQRSWGLPIPAFYDGEGKVLLTAASVRAIAKLFREEGSDAWFTMEPADLLKHYDWGDAPEGFDRATMRTGHDIFDVWFESGSSWNAVMRERSGGRDYPIDLYLEGSDQHRGWFQLSLLPALGATGVAPFKTVLTHGFMVDKNGQKMSKSLGNTLDVEDLVKEFGADVCRWWLATISYEGDIKSDHDFFRTAGEAYRKVRNTIRFMLSNLDDFTPSPPPPTPGKDCTSGEGMCVAMRDYPAESIDAWVLGEFDKMNSAVREAYGAYNFRGATELLYNFCNDTLSAVYLAAVKDRLYCDRIDSARRRLTQSTLWDLTDGITRLLAVVLPHTADEAARALRKGEDVCVHRMTFVDSFGAPCNENWSKAIDARDAALKALEDVRAKGELDNPLDAGIAMPDPEGVLAVFDAVDLADLMGVSRVTLGGADVEVQDLRGEARCERSWKRDGTVRERSDGGMLSDRDAGAVGV